ncbi:MAG: O-acetyl-ADP-ribose deacetylase [Spirochaetaceae bacterium]|jgi:O-acetyl-ADP-ribose deacetylase (regulator of RNase III)|nr:O-acetyl-ADP-ribose deacetylase [Spirochaetaceae bacterium]
MADIELIMGDITTQKTDAVVNAANSGLLGGGGVDGAIHRAAGSALYDECLKIPAGPHGRCPTGQCVVTGAGRLPCKKVIHTVGPVYSGGKEDSALLADCYRNSLEAAEKAGLESVAFPNISTGVYGYPKPEAARVAIDTVRKTLRRTPSVKRVVFVCFDSENYRLYEELLGKGN